MRDVLYKKGMVLAIIGLFIGAGVLSSMNGIIAKKSEKIEEIMIANFDKNKTNADCRGEVWVDDNWNDLPDGTKVTVDGVDHEIGYDAFDDIQAGIVAVCECDEPRMVHVLNGEYDVLGGISIEYPLRLVGENKDNTIIRGDNESNVIRICASHTNISNFTIKWSEREDVNTKKAGIRIYPGAQYVNIENNNLKENTVGIWVSSDNVSIFNNYIFSNDFDGIVIDSDKCNNQIYGNEIYDNGLKGIKSQGDGIEMRCAHDNIIENNSIYGNLIDGIWMESSSDTIICNNTIENNGNYGIHFGDVDCDGPLNTGNQVINNTIKNNGKPGTHSGGISIYHTTFSIFRENNIVDNENVGFWIRYHSWSETNSRWMRVSKFDCEHNSIYHNNFKHNNYNAVDAGYGTNRWDNGRPDKTPSPGDCTSYGGNYWGDYITRYGKRDQTVWKTWVKKYGICYPLSYKIPTFTYRIVREYDIYPWCEEYGWCPRNIPPEKPMISGDLLGEIGDELKFTAETYEPNGEYIYYKFDWGDGTQSDWYGPFSSGSASEIFHIWDVGGEYNVCAIARDIHKWESDWSEHLEVSIG